ncbi:hypothetical protein PVAP13_3KG112227 [Panicum virgatum]|uniref:Uncharacterized protein n=1 Tax=Panicum virgatum TaxID=38727 RepID=A0A8T0UJF5_PANVG|nr:hypothetical protein PVAP13_3KG112227 [Panicum virgatum]
MRRPPEVSVRSYRRSTRCPYWLHSCLVASPPLLSSPLLPGRAAPHLPPLPSPLCSPSPVVRSSGGARSGGGILGALPAGSELQARRELRLELRQRRRTARHELRQRRRTAHGPAAPSRLGPLTVRQPLLLLWHAALSLSSPATGSAAPAPPPPRGPFPLLSRRRICGPGPSFPGWRPDPARRRWSHHVPALPFFPAERAH